MSVPRFSRPELRLREKWEPRGGLGGQLWAWWGWGGKMDQKGRGRGKGEVFSPAPGPDRLPPLNPGLQRGASARQASGTLKKLFAILLLYF